MIRSRRILVLALFLPIAALAAIAIYRGSIATFGQRFTLPITGYDPRDLLAGDYLTYRVDYGIPGLCEGRSESREAFVCLEPRRFSWWRQDECERFLRGTCHWGRFEAGIERYYIPESKAQELDQEVRSRRASIVIAVTSDGRAQVRDLLVKGEPWAERTEPSPSPSPSPAPSISPAPSDAPSPSPLAFEPVGVLAPGPSVSLRRAEIDTARASLQRVLTQARIVPHFENGGVVGFSVFQIARPSIFSSLGLRNGDLVCGINGKKINDAERAFTLANAVAMDPKLQSFELCVERDGQKRSFRYVVR
jgi:uncharacterized membrane-anchored protein